MDPCFLKGLIVVLLIQGCKSEGLSTSSLPSIETETPRDGRAASATAPVAAPLNLKEVEQAVQEASERTERRGAEEVLKELLERVVEAALMEVRGGGEETVGRSSEKVKEVVVGVEKGEAKIEPEVGVVKQAPEEALVLDDIQAQKGDVGGGEDQGVETEVEREPEVFETAIQVEGIVGGEGEVAGQPVAEVIAGGDVGGTQEEEAAIDVSPSDPEVPQEVGEEEVGGGPVEEEETGGNPEEELTVMSEEGGASEMEAEQETLMEPNPGLGGMDVLHTLEEGGGEEAGVKAIQGGVVEGGVAVVPLPPVEEEIEMTHTEIEGEPIGEEDVEEEIVGQVEERGAVVVEEGGAEEVQVGELGAAVGREAGGVIVPENRLKEVKEGGADQHRAKAGVEQQLTVETSTASQAEDQEVLVIAAPAPGVATDVDEASVEQGPTTQTAPLSPSMGGQETNNMDGEELLKEESNRHANEISSTGGRLPHDPALAKPTRDNVAEEVEATPPLLVGAEPREANDLAEESAGSSEAGKLGLEAWKIGAISAAVFLVLETTVIIIYIVKCCNKTNSTSASQKACEEGCVEPEAATGGNCGDDTLPADKGNPQRTTASSPFLRHLQQHQHEEQAVAMLDLPPSSADESDSSGARPVSPQGLRTSVL